MESQFFFFGNKKLRKLHVVGSVKGLAETTQRRKAALFLLGGSSILKHFSIKTDNIIINILPIQT